MTEDGNCFSAKNKTSTRATKLHPYILGFLAGFMLLAGYIDAASAQGNADYPMKARQLKAEGSVVLQVDIDEQGNPSNVRFVRFENMNVDDPEVLEEFKTQSIETVQKAKFKPATDHGMPVATKDYVMKLTYRCKVGDQNNCR